MAENIYVYIPGFTYESKGPLQIDAIKLDALIGNLVIEDVYVYANTPNSIPGNVIYRTTEYSTYLLDTLTAKDTVLFTSELLRVKYGYFYDFVSSINENGKQKHVLSYNINSGKTYAKNFNINEHDGLFVLKINELNTVITLKFTLYSRVLDIIDSYDNLIQFGEPYIPNDFTETGLTNGFIKIGEMITSYNPAIVLRNSYSDPLTVSLQQQYYDLKNWGTSNIKTWEIPFNGDILVSRHDSTSLYTDSLNNNGYYKQYSYCLSPNDVNFRHHILNSLICNSKSATDFYYDFYKSKNTQYLDSITKDSTLSVKNNKVVAGTSFLMFLRKDSDQLQYAKFAQDVKWAELMSNKTYNTEINYIPTYINLNNFNYLYKTTPSVTIKNMATDRQISNIPEDLFDPLVIGISTIGGRATHLITDITGSFSELALDLQGIINYNQSGVPLSLKLGYWFYLNQEWPVNGCNPISSINSNDLQNKLGHVYLSVNSNLLDLQILSNYSLNLEYELGSGSTKLYNPFTQNIFSNLESYIDTLYNPIVANKSYNTNCYLSAFETNSLAKRLLTNSTILTTPSFIFNPLLNDKISININLNNFLVPLAFYYTQDAKHAKNSAYGFNEIVKDVVNKNRTTILTQDIKNNYQNTENYNLRPFIIIPSMYSIDLNESINSFNNQADYSVCPAFYYNEVGYLLDGTFTDINIDLNNLLLNNTTDSFEIKNVIEDNTNTSIFKKPFELINNKINATLNYFDTSFCNEARFIQENVTKLMIASFGSTLIIADTLVVSTINKGVSITEPGFYLLKLNAYNISKLNAKVAISDANMSGNIHSMESNNGMWLIYIKNPTTFNFCITCDMTYSAQPTTPITNFAVPLRQKEQYNYISGVGLYKVLTENEFEENPNSAMLNAGLSSILTTSILSINSNIYAVDSKYLNKDYIQYVITPAIYCLQENILFCNEINNKPINTDYGIISTPEVTKEYNFAYLPIETKYTPIVYYNLSTTTDTVDTDKITKIQNIDIDNTQLPIIGTRIRL